MNEAAETGSAESYDKISEGSVVEPHTRQQWGAKQANRHLDILTTAFAELAATPKIDPACDHINAGYSRRNSERHMIYFQITTYGIAVVRILHDRMDAPRYL